jgi:hypothetical protein
MSYERIFKAEDNEEYEEEEKLYCPYCSKVGLYILLSQKLKKASFGYRDLVGQVKNIGNDSAESINVLLTVYDKNGGVIGTDSIYTDVSTLKPGQKSTFKILASSDDFKGMDHYELSLKWSNADSSEGYVENAQIYKANTTSSNN